MWDLVPVGNAVVTTTIPTERNGNVRIFSELLTARVSVAAGWPQLQCQLMPESFDIAAAVLAVGIVDRRIAMQPRLHERWRSLWIAHNNEESTATDQQLFEGGLLQNLGTPDQPSPTEHLHGLVAESIWYEVVSEVDAGLGIPLRVEGHNWSATDPGGDGLTIYQTADDSYCFRLWESKHHGADAPVRNTVNTACRQVQANATSYLSRFSQLAQQVTDDRALASFYGMLAEHWVNRDPAAGVGISVGTDDNANVNQCFGNVTNYFEFAQGQHQGQLHLMGDFAGLAIQVRNQVWKGCGLWTGR